MRLTGTAHRLSWAGKNKVKQCRTQRAVMTRREKPRSRVYRECSSPSVPFLSMWLWPDGGRACPTTVWPHKGRWFSDLAQHLAERTATVVRGCSRPKTVFCFLWWFQKCGVSERKFSSRAPSVYPEGALTEIAAAELQCKCFIHMIILRGVLRY